MGGGAAVSTLIRLSLDGVSIKVAACIDEAFCESLRRAGYLSEDGTLDPLEAVYQVSRGRAELEGCGGGWSCAIQMMAVLEIDLDLFTVYRDLRRKGRRPRKGFRRKTLLYEREGRIYEVLVLSEGYVETLRSIIEWSRQAAADDHVPIIAVVDRTGLVTYYEARASRSIQ
jgi:tRNA-intron endonuclease